MDYRCSSEIYCLFCHVNSYCGLYWARWLMVIILQVKYGISYLQNVQVIRLCSLPARDETRWGHFFACWFIANWKSPSMGWSFSLPDLPSKNGSYGGKTTFKRYGTHKVITRPRYYKNIYSFFAHIPDSSSCDHWEWIIVPIVGVNGILILSQHLTMMLEMMKWTPKASYSNIFFNFLMSLRCLTFSSWVACEEHFICMLLPQSATRQAIRILAPLTVKLHPNWE